MIEHLRRRRRGPATVAAMTVLLVAACTGPSGRGAQRTTDRVADAPLSSTAPTTASTPNSQPPNSQPPSTRPPSRPAVVTPQGMWWGVDSTEAISKHTLRNVRQWYRGARPQFWGRYLRGDYGVTQQELAFARRHGIYVYVIVGDRNCSGCSGGDLCDNDRTSGQAQRDADSAVKRARELRLPSGTTLFKDIEQVSSCRGEPTRDYLLAWYRTVRSTGYRTGFYGNVHKQHYDFPVAYCKAAAADPAFARDVWLDMNQPEPELGAPRGSTAPGNAPKYRPNSPSCADPARTVIWQYGESIDRDNLTDIDQARPDTPGLLAPDGGVT